MSEAPEKLWISARHALTNDEVQFCRVHLAMGERNASEAYRRAYMVQDDGKWFERDARGNRKGQPRQALWVAKKASDLLKKDHIKLYMKELKTSTSDSARAALAENVRFGDPTEALRAANRILDDEDKLGFRDAVEEWAAIMAEVGAEVVLPLPGSATGEVFCPECFHQFVATLPIEVTAPMREMFPHLRRKGDDQESEGRVQGRVIKRKAPKQGSQDT